MDTGKLKLWLISQTVNSADDTYDAAVVAAHSEEEARGINPGSGIVAWEPWASFDFVTAKEIGTASEGIAAGEVICASFNPGD